MRYLFYVTLFAFILLGYFVLPFSLDMVVYSDGRLNLLVSDVFILAGVLSLFVEAIKASLFSAKSIFEDTISMFVAVAYLLIFIFVPEAHTTTFLILTCMVFVDAIAGFIITANVSRRDFTSNADLL
jgi:hypothetical protein